MTTHATIVLSGAFNDGKGQPSQSNAVSHGSATHTIQWCERYQHWTYHLTLFTTYNLNLTDYGFTMKEEAKKILEKAVSFSKADGFCESEPQWTQNDGNIRYARNSVIHIWRRQ